MIPDSQEQQNAFDRFADRHKALTSLALIGMCAFALETQDIPAIAAPIAAAKYIVGLV